MAKNSTTAERKTQIVDATIECIARHGYNNFSMQDVAKAAGVSKGIIHYYFLNKDDLMLCVLEKVVANIELLLHKTLSKASSTREKLQLFIEVCTGLVETTQPYYQVNMDFWTQINHKPEIKEIVAGYYERFRFLCTKVLEQGVKEGTFKEHSSKEYSSIIMGVVDGVSIQYLFDKNAFDYKNVIAKTTEMILNAITLNKVPSNHE